MYGTIPERRVEAHGFFPFLFFFIDTAYLTDSCVKIKDWVYKITSPTHVRSFPHISSWKIREETFSFIETNNYEETNMCRTIRGAFEGKSVKKKKKLITRLKMTAKLQSGGGFDSADSYPWGDSFGTRAYWAVWNTLSLIFSGLNGSYTNNYV